MLLKKVKEVENLKILNYNKYMTLYGRKKKYKREIYRINVCPIVCHVDDVDFFLSRFLVGS